jgi:hypothetical protein
MGKFFVKILPVGENFYFCGRFCTAAYEKQYHNKVSLSKIKKDNLCLIYFQLLYRYGPIDFQDDESNFNRKNIFFKNQIRYSYQDY